MKTKRHPLKKGHCSQTGKYQRLKPQASEPHTEGAWVLLAAGHSEQERLDTSILMLPAPALACPVCSCESTDTA